MIQALREEDRSKRVYLKPQCKQFFWKVKPDSIQMVEKQCKLDNECDFTSFDAQPSKMKVVKGEKMKEFYDKNF